jgi:DNA-binding FadR family transcriptional regulator
MNSQLGHLGGRLTRTSVLNLLQAIENKKFLAKKPQKRVHVNERMVSVPGDRDMLRLRQALSSKSRSFAIACNM